ncbi:hypothetical protein OUZ56_025400 [Daphnia magna]|uniref:Uncharacterized protein n=1 Tax=Daphnia magna TaxID=35525 RepID=A0ABQ9ZJV8_9CRUS|nr:hypothetical protein OUZ56_025400 [Daphnia magna]
MATAVGGGIDRLCYTPHPTNKYIGAAVGGEKINGPLCCSLTGSRGRARQCKRKEEEEEEKKVHNCTPCYFENVGAAAINAHLDLNN